MTLDPDSFSNDYVKEQGRKISYRINKVEQWSMSIYFSFPSYIYLSPFQNHPVQ